MSLILSSKRPLLNQLSSATTVIGAWSTGQLLKAGVANGPFTATNSSSVNQNAVFTGNILNTVNLLAFAAGASAGLTNFHDQSGSGNNLPIFSGQQPTIVSSGALNKPVTIPSGQTLPLASIGYNGIGGGLGPWLRLAAMVTSFGTATVFGALTILRLVASLGNPYGEYASFLHTGDTFSYATTTSACLGIRNNITTTGAVTSFRNGSALSAGAAPLGSLTMLGSIFDGTNNTLYIDRTAQPPVASSGALGSGGAYAMGDDASSTTVNSNMIAADFAAQLIFFASSIALLMPDFLLMQNVMRSFWGTP